MSMTRYSAIDTSSGIDGRSITLNVNDMAYLLDSRISAASLFEGLAF